MYVCEYVLLIILLISINNKVDAACSNGEWNCDNGECIDEDQLCDGDVNCRDGSDEIAENCIHLTCPTYAFHCAYGACVAGKYKCNNIKNCADNSDELEMLCSGDLTRFYTQLQGNCSDDNYMQCGSGECIDRDYSCDGTLHCRDGSDETVELCSTTNCQSYAFRCGYGACIDGKAKCNDKADCADGSDEAAILCGRKRGTTIPQIPSPTMRPTPPPRPPPVSEKPAVGFCRIPSDLGNVIITPKMISSDVPAGTIIEFSCKRGYTLVDKVVNRQAYCSLKGWNREFPKCYRYCNPSKLHRGFSTVVESCSFDGRDTDCYRQIRVGTIATIKCASGFEMPANLGPRYELTCTDKFEWSLDKRPCLMKCGHVQAPTTEFSRGGVDVNITEMPWHVGIYSRFDAERYKHSCGGSIISPRLVLTAAHCFWDLSNPNISTIYDTSYYQVVAGKYFRDYYSATEYFPIQRRNISKILIPPDFQSAENYYQDDLAVLILYEHFIFTYFIRPVCIEFSHPNVISNMRGTFAAWGAGDDANMDVLKSIDMFTYNFDDCKRTLQGKTTNYRLANDKFCVHNDFGNTACRGDSGGGFVLKMEHVDHVYYRLVGIVSHAPFKVQDCSKDGIIALTNVQNLKDFVEKYRLRDLQDAPDLL